MTNNFTRHKHYKSRNTVVPKEKKMCFRSQIIGGQNIMAIPGLVRELLNILLMRP